MRLNTLVAVVITLVAAALHSPVWSQTPLVTVTPDSLQVTSGLCEDSILVQIQIQNSQTTTLFYCTIQS